MTDSIWKLDSNNLVPQYFPMTDATIEAFHIDTRNKMAGIARKYIDDGSHAIYFSLWFVPEYLVATTIGILRRTRDIFESEISGVVRGVFVPMIVIDESAFHYSYVAFGGWKDRYFEESAANNPWLYLCVSKKLSDLVSGRTVVDIEGFDGELLGLKYLTKIKHLACM